MGITYNSGAVNAVSYNSNALQRVTYNGNEVWGNAPSYPPYLTFSSDAMFELSKKDETATWDGTIEYSTDKSTWSVWDGLSAISSVADGGTYYIYMRGSGNTIITGSTSSSVGFDSTLAFACDGDIRTLLDYTDPENAVMGEKCFGGLFYGLPITKSPDLPSLTVPAYGYAAMFRGSSLTSAPQLPATTIGTNAYQHMFRDCVELVDAPSISAQNAPTQSLFHMFDNCPELKSLPALKALDYEYAACSFMFNGCAKIKLSSSQTGEYQTPYRIPATGSGSAHSTALNSMFVDTGGTFTISPTINTTYYTSNTVVS